MYSKGYEHMNTALIYLFGRNAHSSFLIRGNLKLYSIWKYICVDRVQARWKESTLQSLSHFNTWHVLKLKRQQWCPTLCPVQTGADTEREKQNSALAKRVLTCSACEARWVSRWQSTRPHSGSRPGPSHGTAWNAPSAAAGRSATLKDTQ